MAVSSSPHSILNTTDIGIRLKTAQGTSNYETLLGFIMQNSNLTSFEGHQVRHVYRHVWPFFVAVCALIFVFGIFVNIRLFSFMLSCKHHGHQHPHHMYRIRAFALLINGIVCDLLKLLIVFPLSVANLLERFYRLSLTVCYIMPLLQYVTIYVPILLYVAIALEFSRAASLHRSEWRLFGLPVLVTSLCIWLIACCLVVPYPPFLHYIDVGSGLGAHFDGIGICAVHKSDRRVTEVIRIAFVILFVAPLAMAAYLTMTSEAESEMNIKFQRSLSTRNTPSAAPSHETGARHSNASHIVLASAAAGKTTNNTAGQQLLQLQKTSSNNNAKSSNNPGGGPATENNNNNRRKSRSKSRERAASAATIQHTRNVKQENDKRKKTNTKTARDEYDYKDDDDDDDDDDENNLQDAEHLNANPLALADASAAGGAAGASEVRTALYKCHSDGSAKRFTALGEKKFVTTLARMIALFALLNAPLQLLMVLHYFVPSMRPDTSAALMFDYLYLAFVPLAFLSALINPILVGTLLSERASFVAFLRES